MVWLVLLRGRPIGNFDPHRYRREITTNTEFCKHDATLCFVIDCPLEAIEPIGQYLDGCVAEQGVRCGMDVADTALMTCLVTSTADSLHVHFVDGGGGEYTKVAKTLKAASERAGLEADPRKVMQPASRSAVGSTTRHARAQEPDSWRRLRGLIRPRFDAARDSTTRPGTGILCTGAVAPGAAWGVGRIASSRTGTPARVAEEDVPLYGIVTCVSRSTRRCAARCDGSHR